MPSSTTPPSTPTPPHPTPEGHPRTLAVNTLAPYLLTGLVERPDRLIYLTSDMHLRGDDSRETSTGPPADGTGRRGVLSDSKLFVTTPSPSPSPAAGPGVLSNAVDPGWVPTRMGRPGAPDDPWSRDTKPRCGSRSATTPKHTAAARSGTTGARPERRQPRRTPTSRTGSSTDLRRNDRARAAQHERPHVVKPAGTPWRSQQVRALGSRQGGEQLCLRLVRHAGQSLGRVPPRAAGRRSTFRPAP